MGKVAYSSLRELATDAFKICLLHLRLPRGLAENLVPVLSTEGIWRSMSALPPASNGDILDFLQPLYNSFSAQKWEGVGLIYL